MCISPAMFSLPDKVYMTTPPLGHSSAHRHCHPPPRLLPSQVRFGASYDVMPLLVIVALLVVLPLVLLVWVCASWG